VPTRYLFDQPFLADESLIQDALAELQESTPAYVIDSARYARPHNHLYDRSGFDQFLAERYEYLGKMHYADIYRLKEKRPQTVPGVSSTVDSAGRNDIR